MPDPIKILQRKLRNTTQTALARELGISVSLLNDTLSGHRTPADKLLKALGLRRVVRYERIPEEPAA